MTEPSRTGPARRKSGGTDPARTETGVGAPRSASTGGWRAMPRAPRRAALPRRRRPLVTLAALGLVGVGAVTAAGLVTAAGDRVEVLVLARDVPLGATLGGDDLGEAAVSVQAGVATVPAAERASVLGLVAASDLPAGSVLARADVAEFAPPAVGEVLVPVALPVSRLPAMGLSAGDRVLLVDAPGPADATGDGPGWGSVPARVVRVGPLDVSGLTVLDVTVPDADGAALAAAAAASRVALVVQPRFPAGAVSR